MVVKIPVKERLLEIVEEMLKTLERVRMTLNPRKCNFRWKRGSSWGTTLPRKGSNLAQSRLRS